MRGTGAALSGSSTPVTGSTFTTTAPAYPAVQPYAVPDTTSAPVAQEDPSASGVLVEREDAGATEGTEKKVEGSVSE